MDLAQTPELTAEQKQGLELLHSSFLRIDGKSDASWAVLDSVRDRARDSGEVLSFHYFFQRALHLHLAGNYSEALSWLSQALRQARAPFEKAHASLNTVICLDSLGLDFTQEKDALHQVLRTCPRDEVGARSVFRQCEAFEARQNFRQGRFSELFNGFDVDRVWDQAQYIKLLVRQLPYHRFNGGFKIKPAENFYQQTYRARTLLGILHPQDAAESRPSDFCARIYLWTWRWLADPEQFPVERIWAGLEEIVGTEAKLTHFLGHLAQDDEHMLKNALRWIILFSARVPSRLDAILKSLRNWQSGAAPLLGFESLVLSWLESRRAGKGMEVRDYWQLLRSHPLFEEKDFFWAALLSGGQSVAGLEILQKSLRGFLADSPASPAEGKILVDPVHFSLSVRDERIISESMVKALRLFRERPVVTIAEFASNVFGLNQFDELVHLPKIHNLIQRMKALFKASGTRLSVSVRGHCIAAESADLLAALTWRHPSAHVSDLARSLRGREWLLSGEGARKKFGPGQKNHGVIAAELLKKTVLTREDIEKATGKSRASANRMIVRWMKEGVLVKKGNAKMTTYQWKGRA